MKPKSNVKTVISSIGGSAHIKLAVGVLSAVWLMFPAIVHAQCTRCCYDIFQTHLAVTPTAAEEKQPVAVRVSVTSYYCVPEVFTATLNISPTVPACEPFADAFKVSEFIGPRETRYFTYTLPAPNCASTYKVKLNGIVRATLTVD